ncbi:MAG: histidine triad nucleotide-binding protein [Pseudomonadales bacterium]|nr:histidine triad nucleotide-binding protein [Pseudomonadales bacterium]
MTEASGSEPSIFTRIINGEIPADILYEDEDCICIKDIAPKAPTHLLIIPRRPIPRLADAGEADKALLGHLMLKVGDIARQVGVDEAFRVVVNNGAGAGQTVFHLHIHLLAGKTYDESALGF